MPDDQKDSGNTDRKSLFVRELIIGLVCALVGAFAPSLWNIARGAPGALRDSPPALSFDIGTISNTDTDLVKIPRDMCGARRTGLLSGAAGEVCIAKVNGRLIIDVTVEVPIATREKWTDRFRLKASTFASKGAARQVRSYWLNCRSRIV
jgi:hypothetical protein